MNVARLRIACSGVAAAGLLGGLVAAGPELPLVALACAVGAIAARPRLQPRLDLPAAVAVAAASISTLLAPQPATAVPMLTCVLVVCGTARLPPRIARALFAGCLALAVLVLALVAAFELAKRGELRSTAYPGLEGWGGFPEMGLLGVMTLPVALSLVMAPGPPEARAGAVVAAVGTAAGVALTGSRAAWGAVLLGAGLVVVGRRRARWPAVTAALGVTLLAIVVALAIWLRPQAASGAVPLDVASRSRLAAWSQAAGLWHERPWIGWGPGSYTEVYTRHHARPADARFHAHSAYLHVAVETGLLGLAGTLWLAAAVFAGSGRRPGPTGPMVAAARVGLVCGFAAVAVRFVVDYFDPAGAGMRVTVWLAVLAGLRHALEAPVDGASG
jgi:O-antigen ligase